MAESIFWTQSEISGCARARVHKCASCGYLGVRLGVQYSMSRQDDT